MSNQYMEEAKAIRASINGLAQGATDEKIIDNKAAFPWWNGNGVNYVTGDILRYNDSVYRVLQNHTSQNDWTPDIAVSLYVEISVEEFPKWKQPTGAQDAYKKGDKVSYDNKHWISTVDNNVWQPGVYGWDEYAEEIE